MPRYLLGPLCLLVIISLAAQRPGTAWAADIASGGGKITTRLPDIATPDNYRLKFRPNLVRFTFQGEETVSVTLSKPSSAIVMNAIELTVSSASLSDRKGKLHLPGKVTLNPLAEQVRISFPGELQPGQYDLKLAFSGVLNDKLRGFYRSFYSDEHGLKHILATTQMEPTDARRMFPCFDEPCYKATFEIATEIDSNLVAISNAPVLRQTNLKSGGKKEVVFDKTPKMSTYLVTLIIGNFESTPATTAAGVPIRVWAVKGKARLGDYARKFAARLLPFYNNYFGVPYPAKKLDLIAIPDFEAGAMENLGAITFREKALLVDESKSATETLQNVAGIVAHEMAHLWFGDLVTMKWWDDLWLNEAFATWMSTKAVNNLVPEWHFWDCFGLERSQALQTDALKSTRPIHFTVNNPNQINEMFDEITYEKGASVLRMLEKYVGKPVFQKGVAQYISAHQFGNASTADLWQAVGEAAHLPVPEMMLGWVSQPGYPLISLERAADGKTISLSQKRFFLDATADGAEGKTGSPVWTVPVVLRDLAAGGATTTELLKSPAETYNINSGTASASKAWLANAGSDGFFRVHYAGSLLNELTPLVQSNLTPAERLSLINDQWSLAVSGQLPVTDYLALTSAFKVESDPSVAKALIGQLYHISSLLDNSARGSFERFVRDRLGQIKEKLGWTAAPKESALVQVLRGNVLETLGTIGQDKATIAEARKLFEQYLKKPESLNPDLIDAVTVIVAYNGGDEEYQEIKRLWKEAKTPEQEQRNLICLGTFRQPELVRKTLLLCLSDEVRTQDQPRLLGSLLRQEASKVAAWQFVKDNWSQIVRRFPLNMVPRIVSAICLSERKQEEEVRSFFSSHKVPAGEHAVSRMLERMQIDTTFRERSGSAIYHWLEKTDL